MKFQFFLILPTLEKVPGYIIITTDAGEPGHWKHEQAFTRPNLICEYPW